jgi:O-antigen ligase
MARTLSFAQPRAPKVLLGHVPGRAHLAVAGLVTAYLAFRSGGFFPRGTGVVAAILAIGMVLRVTLSRDPFAGWSPLGGVVAGAGALLACWILISSAWSDAPGRALAEFDRVLLYLLLFAACAGVARRPGDLAVLLRWVLLAIVAAAVAGLATRLLPDVFEAVPGLERGRLAFPLTYWNAMSVFCALGLALALHAASGEREPRWVRAGATAALPVLAVGVYLPLSRGGIATAVVAVLLFAVLARPPRLPAALLAGVPPMVVSVVVAYGADALTTPTYFEPPGPEQGHRVALVVAACALVAGALRLALARLDVRMESLYVPRARRRALWAAAVAGVVAVAAVGAVAVDAPDRVRAQYRAFVHGNIVDVGPDLRQRLRATGNNGRLATWRVARDTFAAWPLRGTGAGTYEIAWQRARPGPLKVVDGHSLYLETLAELGLVGALLLLVMLGGIVVALARGMGERAGPDRHASAAALAAGVALLLHAAIDWDWEMPALLAWLFAAGGVACARAAVAVDRPGPAQIVRVVAGLALLLLAITPAVSALADGSLHRANAAFARGDCTATIDAALDSTATLAVRPEPYELIGYCDLRLGATGLALRAMEAARRHDPHSWRPAYGLAVAQALAGRDPRAAAAEARRLNPLAPEARALEARLRRATGPAGWRRAGALADLPS